MVVQETKRLNAHTTEEEWDAIDKCRDILENIVMAMVARKCDMVSTPDYDGETIDYSIADIKRAIELLDNIKDMEEIY